MDYSKERIAILGLGYVGLPLAVAFSKKRKVLAYDIDSRRIEELSNGLDKTYEVNPEEILKKDNLNFSNIGTQTSSVAPGYTVDS